MLDNSANTTSFVGKQSFTPPANALLLFEGHTLGHNVSKVTNPGERRIMNLLLTTSRPRKYS